MTLQIVIRNRIVLHVYLRLVACRWWNHELWLVATKIIFRSSSEDVDRGGTWWWSCFQELENGDSLTSQCVYSLIWLYNWLYVTSF